MPIQYNLFANKTGAMDDEREDVLLKNPNIRITRILSQGQTSEVYDQTEDEWIAVLEGKATLKLLPDTEASTATPSKITLKTGDTYFLPAHTRHQVTYTSDPCIWLCVFFPAQK